MKITKRKILVFIILAALAGGGFLVWRILGKGEQKPTYNTAQVERGNIVATVSGSGNLSQTAREELEKWWGVERGIEEQSGKKAKDESQKSPSN